MTFVTVAAVTLTSVPLDFEGNLDRILTSIRIAKAKGARLRTGPELEICGYGCLDHFLEGDTYQHSWEILSRIIADPVCEGLLLDLGMPVRHHNTKYNCRVFCTFRRIYGIRPKMFLANDGLYREARYFSPWQKTRTTETYELEQCVAQITGQTTCQIGDMIIQTVDTSVSAESCEELFTPINPSSGLGLAGCEILLNGSASHAELQKLRARLDLIKNATRKLGGVYIYCNMTGVDGEARMLFDGSSMVLVNGEVVAQASQFSLQQVEVTIATVDIEAVRAFRGSHSRGMQAASQPDYPRIQADLTLGRDAEEIYLSDTVELARPRELKILDAPEEIYMAEAVWLFGYLRRSNAAGFFLCLSGGLDSSTVALFVFGMGRLILQSIERGEADTLTDLRHITGDPSFLPQSPQDIVGALFHTAYMSTTNSSEATRSRAQRLADSIGSYHSDVKIDEVVSAFENVGATALDGFRARFKSEGGSSGESLARQNVQARSRMVLAYELAQLSTQARKLPRAGTSLLVLGSGNVDENLRGYYTKYDASSADLAPLGSISKLQAQDFQRWAMVEWNMPILHEFLNAKPTAELIPIHNGLEQSDEEEMQLTYAELSVFGQLRRVERLGPWSSYLRLLSQWSDRRPRDIADKVMKFYRFYAINRHKATVLTPSVHLSAYDPDDNRHDERPFLYNINWPFQFGKITEHVDGLERKLAEKLAEKQGHKPYEKSSGEDLD